MLSYTGWSSTGDIVFTQTRPQIIWQNCRYILDLVNLPKWIKILQHKHISIDVHKCLLFGLDIFTLFASKSPEIKINFITFCKVNLGKFRSCTFNCHVEKTFLKLNGPFSWMGFNCVIATEPLQGDNLLFTTMTLGVHSTQFIDLWKIKSWVNLGATQWFWNTDSWIRNPVS